ISMKGSRTKPWILSSLTARIWALMGSVCSMIEDMKAEEQLRLTSTRLPHGDWGGSTSLVQADAGSASRGGPISTPHPCAARRAPNHSAFRIRQTLLLQRSRTAPPVRPVDDPVRLAMTKEPRWSSHEVLSKTGANREHIFSLWNSK